MKKGIWKDKNVFAVEVIIFKLNVVLISKEKSVKKHLQNSTYLLEGETVVKKAKILMIFIVFIEMQMKIQDPAQLELLWIDIRKN